MGKRDLLFIGLCLVGAVAFGVPVFTLCVALAFVIQWAAFVPAYLRQTERFYDLTGSLTYVSVAIIAVVTRTMSASITTVAL